MTALLDRFIALENIVHRLLVRHSVSALRIAVGAIFLGFGVLKYFPGVSPAERLATDTTDVLFLGLVPPDIAIVVIATMECFIGICFLIGTGALMRMAIWVLAAQFVGILSPLLIEPGTLFSATPRKRCSILRIHLRGRAGERARHGAAGRQARQGGKAESNRV